MEGESAKVFGLLEPWPEKHGKGILKRHCFIFDFNLAQNKEAKKKEDE